MNPVQRSGFTSGTEPLDQSEHRLALGISTLIDIAVFFWFTKPMMTLLARRRFFNSGSRFSGLSRETLGIDQSTRHNLAGGRV